MGFACVLVARSGTADLGRWVDEERRLISVSFLQGGEGRGEFGRIEFVDGNETVRVVP